jgi:hypothetical protein
MLRRIVWWELADVSEVLYALMMDAVSSSEKSVSFYKTTIVGTNLCVPRPLEVKGMLIRGAADKHILSMRSTLFPSGVTSQNTAFFGREFLD